MANRTDGGGSVSSRAARASKAEREADSAERTITKRTVLRRERVLVLPDEITPEQQKAIAAALGVKVAAVPVIEAWQVCGEFDGDRRRAIEGYAGKAGTPDAKPGTYRAPSSSAWRGGEVYEKPPEPIVERKALDD